MKAGQEASNRKPAAHSLVCSQRRSKDTGCVASAPKAISSSKLHYLTHRLVLFVVLFPSEEGGPSRVQIANGVRKKKKFMQSHSGIITMV